MRAMVLERPGPIDSAPLSPRELPDPEPATDELLVRVMACAVCRTDLQVCEGDLRAPALPLIPGHQVVGRVDAVGSSVREWSVGDRVGVAWLAWADGTCALCRDGRENLCAGAQFTGLDRNGGYAERITVRAAFALRIPDVFSDVDAAPLLCGGVIGYRSLLLSGVQPGGRLGLFGFGASALLTLQVAVHQHMAVYVVSRSEAERQRALGLGATWAGSYEERVPAPLDGAITFAPVGSVVVAALGSLAPGGTVAINAIHLDRIPAFDYDLLWRERVIRSVANFTRHDAAAFLALAGAIPIVPQTRTMPLEQANRALQDIKSGDVAGTPVLRPAADQPP